MSETDIHVTSGSIFDDADLNFPPDHRIKAELVDEIGRRMAADGLTQARAAAQMGIAQPDLSNILRGKFRGCSVDRLTAMLGRLGYGVDIILRPPASNEALRTVHVSP
jgi:predicted XRE-type DNA-binding protein